MKILKIFRQALIAISRNKGRSFLTILGIIIGIGSVIALVSLGQGVKNSVSSQIDKLGSATITITPGNRLASATTGGGSTGSSSGSSVRQATSTLTENDYNSLNNKIAHPLLKYISGEIGGSSIYTVSGSQERVSVLGVSEQYAPAQSLAMANGRTFTIADMTSSSQVVILGSSFATDYYGSKNPVGQVLQVNGQNYTVIGVFKAESESSFNNPNNQIYIPYTAAMVTFDTQTFSSIAAVAINSNDVNGLQTDITNTLLKNHNITDKKLADFSVLTSADLLSTITTVTGLLTSLLAGIAAISLVVGGIGIMNIMLVSVTERTREIGLRKAVGAKTSDILGQFITEAILLTIIGGLLGIGLGYLIGRIASHFIGFNAAITPSSILLAVGVSSAVGLIFGIYPAAKASRLNPIDALRYE